MTKPFLLPGLLLIYLAGTPVFAQTDTTLSFMHQGIQRDYLVHLPPGFSGAQSLPVFYVLPGGAGNGGSARTITQMNAVADTGNFVVVYPNGGYEVPNSPGSYVWADGRGTPADTAVDDVDFFRVLFDSVATQFNVDTARQYITGISNGGFMAQRVACNLSSRLAGAAIVAATADTSTFGNCSLSGAMPSLQFHGTADAFVPIEGGAMQNAGFVISADSLLSFYARENGCGLGSLDSTDLPDIDATDNSTATLFELSGCDCGFAPKLYRLNGGGHTWPGVEIAQVEAQFGETNEDIHASRVMWTRI